MMSHNKEVWFPEPTVADDTWAYRGETVIEWLHRSSLPRAKASRQFLNYNISQLPQAWRSRLVHDLNRKQWDSVFFELIVARVLQTLGAELRVEEVTAHGKRPDFQAIFATGTITVEAISPQIDSQIDQDAANQTPLLQIIERLAPPDVTIFVETLPLLNASDSKRDFKRTVADLLNVQAPIDEEIIELRADTLKGPIELSVVARHEGWPIIGGTSGTTVFSNRIDRLRLALKKKREQVRGG